VYIELHAASAFSFLDGASTPEALVDRAADLGYSALALVDRDGVYGAPRFYQAARAAGLKALVGAELTIAGTVSPSRVPSTEYRAPSVWSLPVLVASREGYRNLCRLVTRMKLGAPTSFRQGSGGPPELQRRRKGEGALALEDLDGATEGLVALAGRAALVGGRYGVGGLVDRLVGIFGRTNVFVEIQRHLRRDEASDNQALLDLASAFRVPVVATGGVRFAAPDARPLYDVLTCIRHKTTLAGAGRRLSVNAERYLKPTDQMARLFADLPRAVAETRELADRLEFTLADLGYRFPDYPVPDGETQASFLRKIAEVGARERYRPYHERARRQIARELDLIEKLDLAGYFLIVWDIVNFCRQQGILAQGRGSAANSAVCYSLGITAVDPVGMDLLFERFLSEERGEWPDIDLDLPSGDRRERVIQHVYGKYGRFGAAMTANVISYRGRSAAREVGKVLDLDAGQVDRLAKVMSHFEWVDPKDSISKQIREAGFDEAHPTLRLFADLWRRIQHLPRHLGQHSGGMVICRGRLDEVVPLENASMPGRVVVQWDKDDCADLGIVKVDLLGLGMMAVLQDALEIINGSGGGTRYSVLGEHGAERGVGGDLSVSKAAQVSAGSPSPESRAPSPVVDLAHLPPDDPEVYRMLQAADTIGVFQVESRAQMATLPRLKPACFYDIVVEVALIRPGPIVGQMVHPYIRRRQGVEPVVYPHPSLEPILKRTLGVPLFQEQLLRMAMVAAGFSGGEAEELRRAFGFKRSVERMKKIETKLTAGMARQGITGEAAETILRSISSFALYGFPESHAASFALIVYASAYLKAHYPAAFYAAMLNNFPMGFYHPATLVKDAQRRGVAFAPVDVERSWWDCTIEPDGRVRLGLRYISGLREDVGRAIEDGGRDRGMRGRKLPRNDHGMTTETVLGTRGSGGAQAKRDESGRQPPADSRQPEMCPKCGCDDSSMLEVVRVAGAERWFCNVCAHEWQFDGTRGSVLGTRNTCGGPASEYRAPAPPLFELRRPRRSLGEGGSTEYRRFSSLDDLIVRTGLRRDEVSVLAEAGALEAFGYDRRSALWQVERAVRPAGELFEGLEEGESVEAQGMKGSLALGAEAQSAKAAEHRVPAPLLFELRRPRRSLGEGGSTEPRQRQSPLRPMTPLERVAADYAGTGLTIGPHPMSFRRREMALRGILRAIDLPRGRHGRRVRVAGAVITRQRPGTAKGFVFLTLEDETGIANVIVRPDLFAEDRLTIVREPYLIVEGTLQIQEGVTSIKAERVRPLDRGEAPEVESHDFY